MLFWAIDSTSDSSAVLRMRKPSLVTPGSSCQESAASSDSEAHTADDHSDEERRTPSPTKDQEESILGSYTKIWESIPSSNSAATSGTSGQYARMSRSPNL